MISAAEAVPALAGAALWILPGPPSQARVQEWCGPTAARGGRRRVIRIIVPPAVIVLGSVLGWSIAAAGALVGATALHLKSRHRKEARSRRERTDLSAALEVIVAELRSGAHPGQACRIAAAHITAGPVADVLTRASAQALLGGSVPRVLAGGTSGSADGRTPTRRPADTEPAWQWRRIAAVWSVSERKGIALAGLLDAARADLVTRESFHRRAEAGLAGARSTAAVLAALPVVGVALGELMGAAPLQVLSGGGIGSILLCAGIVFDCAGVVWSERIASGAAR